MSYIFDPLGRMLAPGTSETSSPVSDRKNAASGFIYAEFSKDDLQKMRMKLPVVNDSDDYNIIGME